MRSRRALAIACASVSVLALSTVPAHAQLLLTGAGKGSPTVVPAYDPQGVLIQPDVFIGTNSAMNTTNSKNWIESFWINGSENNVNTTSVLNAGPIVSKQVTACEITIGTAPDNCISFDNSAFKAQFSFNNATGTVNATDAIKFQGDGNQTHVFPQSQWNHYIITGDAASGHVAIVVNGVNVFGSVFTTSVYANTTPGFASGLHLMNGVTPVVNGWGYMADTVIFSQKSAVCTGVGAPATMFGVNVTCAAADTMPPEILSRFYSAGPVNPGTNCTSLLPDGSQPEVCQIGSGTAMATSHGTATPGVAIAAVPILTGGALFQAPYGPRGIPAHQATMRWMQSNVFATVTSNAMTTDAGGSPIVAGDLIVIVAETGNNSVLPTGAACPSGGANTWHTVGPVNDSVEDVQSIMCWTIAQGGDLSGAWTVPWTAAGTRTHGWAMADYANVASVDQSGSKLNSPVTTTHTTAAGLTTASANETVISAWVHWEANTPNTTFNPPATGTTRYRVWKTANYAMIHWVDEYAVASGSNPQRTITTAAADTSAGFTLTLVPN